MLSFLRLLALVWLAMFMMDSLSKAQGITEFQYDAKWNQTTAIISAICTAPNSTTVCFSLQTGYWSDTNVWSCGHVPTINDMVIIGPSKTISLSGVGVTYSAKRISYMLGSKLVYGNSSLKLQIKDG